MRKHAIYLVAVVIGLLSASEAMATEVGYTGTIKLFALDAKSDANFIQMSGVINSACQTGSNSRAYIRREQTQILAAALSAAAQNISVYVLVDTAGSSMALHGSTPSTFPCEVIEIIVN